MRVQVTQSFPLDVAKQMVLRSEYPAQQLWGADHLERLGWEVAYVAAPKENPKYFLPPRIVDSAGGIGQQWAIARARRVTDVSLAGRAQVTRGLGIARSLGIWRHPMVAIFHNPVPRARGIGTAWVRGVDVALCLTQLCRRNLIEEHGRSPETTLFAPWGPDLAFEHYLATGSDQIVTAGKDNRDFGTLIAALSKVEFPAVIHAPQWTGSVPSWIDIRSPAEGASQRSYLDVLAELRRAAIVAIPAMDPDRLTGLTEVNDALALGKPIVMTRSPHYGAELEKAGCAVLVEPGDVTGWTQTLTTLLDDPERLTKMGAAARKYAESEWNYEIFCQKVERALQIAVDASRNGPRAR